MSAHAPSMQARPADDARPSTFKVWLAAIRPATLPAGAVPVLVGTALAAAHGELDALPAAAALLGAALIQIGTNLFNDYADFARGADTAARLGPARATQRGWLGAREVALASALVFALAVLTGTYLVAHAGWPIVVVGLLSVICGLAYTGGPLPLAYVGLGDVFVFVFFGLVAVAGTYYVQALALAPAVWIAAAPIGFISTAILVVNNLRDRHTDAPAGKRTLAVRLGERFTRVQYATLVALAYLVPALAAALGATPWTWLTCLLSAPIAVAQVRGVLTRDGAALNQHLGGTGKLLLAYGVTLAGGMLL